MDKTEQFWWFCNERENIRRLKESGAPRPWTQDPILHRHKFTNINRIHDRGTKLLHDVMVSQPPFTQFCASAIYRFSGSNNSLITMMHENSSDLWFERLGRVTPLFNMSAYQANWPAGKGKGVAFMTKYIERFCVLSYKQFKETMDIIGCRDIMCDNLEFLGYKRMRFQTTEIAKDLSMFGIVDPDSECPMNVGAIRGLINLFNSSSTKNVEILTQHPKNPGYNTQILEHALCEYSKYCDYETGVRKDKNKVYTPYENVYNTTKEKTT